MTLGLCLLLSPAWADDFVTRVNRLRAAVVKLEGHDWLGKGRDARCSAS
ncbi:MAG: hypothetical protein FJ102_05835 [Deltaproteobacteria bacterium]|nr:hypothetical protein [Deltaproteobacteria bacterium]